MRIGNARVFQAFFFLNYVLKYIITDVYHSTINIGNERMRILAIYAPPGPEAELREMEGVIIEPPKRNR